MAPEDKTLAYKRLRDRVLDSRIANAIKIMKDEEEARERGALDKQAFKQL